MEKIKCAVIGTGFIGLCHIDALRRLGFVEVAAVADNQTDLARRKAAELGIKKCYDSVDELLADEEISVVHNCTPNRYHLEINRKIIEAGKHVFSEKPLCMSSAESAELVRLTRNHPDVVHAVNFNYRMFPMVQKIKKQLADGEFGRPYLIHGSYLQDWLSQETDYNWRIEPEIGGPSRSMADIGSHWMDLAQYVTGARITSVCADLFIAYPYRKKPERAAESFQQGTGAYTEKKVTTEDYGAVLFKMDNGSHGVFYVSQISAGRKNDLNFEINASKCSVAWNQEDSEKIWIGRRNEGNVVESRGVTDFHEDIRQYSHLPAGHPQGWTDALKNSLSSFYTFIAQGKKVNTDSCPFVTFGEGYAIMKLVDAVMESGAKKEWVDV